MSRRRKGFSFIELLLGMMLLAILLTMVFPVISSSSQTAMDAYFEMLGFQLAREPLEVFQSFGYTWLTGYAERPDQNPLPDFPLGTWHSVQGSFMGNPANPSRPAEIENFERLIELTPGVQAGAQRGIGVTVNVRPKHQSRIASLLKREVISLSTVVLERSR